MNSLPLLFAGLIVLAGCLEGTQNPRQVDADVEGVKPPQFASADACTGLDVRAQYGILTDNADHPPGWERRDPDPASNVIVLLADCPKLNWGPFARPVKFLVEMHANLTPPAECFEDAAEEIVMLRIASKVWVNDTEVAEWLAQTYPGIPVGNFTFEQEVEGSPVGQVRVTWKPENGPESEFSGQRITGEPSDLLDGVRLFWWNTTGVTMLDLMTSFRGTTQVAAGTLTLRDPMIHGTQSETTVGVPSIYEPAQFTMEITRFKDFECQEEYQ